MENIISSVFETLGLGVFFYYLIRSLKQKVAALESTINSQGKTLDVMERRVQETEKIGDIYRNLMSDLPKDLDNFKTVMSKTKDEAIIELRNQNELTKKKLEEAQRQIEKSRNSPELIKRHLQVLKNILSKPKGNKRPMREYELAEICTYGGRTLEQCVPLILESFTFEDFMKATGFKVILTEDDTLLKNTFKDRKAPDGEPLRYGRMTQSITGAWSVMVNDDVYINNAKLSELKDEFSAVKTMA